MADDQVSDVHVDSHVLATLREVMEDEFALLLDTFLSDSDERLRLLRQAQAQGDAQAMRMAAHSFKGSCSLNPRVGACCCGSKTAVPVLIRRRSWLRPWRPAVSVGVA